MYKKTNVDKVEKEQNPFYTESLLYYITRYSNDIYCEL